VWLINCKLYLTTCSFCIICCRSNVFYQCFKFSLKLLVYGTIMWTIMLHIMDRRVNTCYLHILYCIFIHFNLLRQPFLKLNQPFTGQTFVSYEIMTLTWEYKRIASSWLSGRVLRKIDISVLAKPNCLPKWFSLFSLFVSNDNWII